MKGVDPAIFLLDRGRPHSLCCRPGHCVDQWCWGDYIQHWVLGVSPCALGRVMGVMGVVSRHLFIDGAGGSPKGIFCRQFFEKLMPTQILSTSKHISRTNTTSPLWYLPSQSKIELAMVDFFFRLLEPDK